MLETRLDEEEVTTAPVACVVVGLASGMLEEDEATAAFCADWVNEDKIAELADSASVTGQTVFIC